MASAAYDRRNERARALGYKSYYDYRAHGNGRLPPSAPRLKGDALARARGHRSGRDLVRAAAPGSFVTATPDVSSRRRDGTYGRAYVTMIDADGKETEFVLQGAALKAARLQQLSDDLDAAGVSFSPGYGDLLALADDDAVLEHLEDE